MPLFDGPLENRPVDPSEEFNHRKPTKRGKQGSFRCGMPAILALETPPSDFLGSLSTHSGE
jgi:hypothetical protein